MDDVRIRPMQTGDIPAAHQLSFDAFAELDTRLGDPVPEHTEALRARSAGRIAHLFGTDPDGSWVVERDGALAGVALALRRGPLWYLSLLTVAPQLQGQGLGRRLLEDELVTRLRSAPYGPDLQVLAAAGVQVLLAEHGAERGFALWTPERLVSVGATSARVAQWLLCGALARTTGEVDVGCVTADQQWAVPVLLAARLAIRPGSSSCRRGGLGPLTPYLPNGAYG